MHNYRYFKTAKSIQRDFIVYNWSSSDFCNGPSSSACSSRSCFQFISSIFKISLTRRYNLEEFYITLTFIFVDWYVIDFYWVGSWFYINCSFCAFGLCVCKTTFIGDRKISKKGICKFFHILLQIMIILTQLPRTYHSQK